jgi:hypothetical protein
MGGSCWGQRWKLVPTLFGLAQMLLMIRRIT